MSVVAPAADVYGAQIDADIATLQALVNETSTASIVHPDYAARLNQRQIDAVRRYMETGWLNAGSNILATYSAASTDAVGQTLTARVAFLQNLYDNAPAMPPGNVEGYGDSGWTTVASNYAQQLYAAQTALVEHLMALPGGTTAATMLANLTGVQTDPAGIPYSYVFSSVGYTDESIDGD